MVFRRWCGSILWKPRCELQVVCQWAFWVCGAMMRQRWVVGSIGWWWWVVRNLVI
jgi:hypothetical protein